MQKFSLTAVIVASLCFCLSAQAADETKLICPVSGHPASKEHAEKYKDGQVYFCCDDCPKAFTANTKKFAAKANAQLAATGQYKEVKCPFSGGKLNPDYRGGSRRHQRDVLLRKVPGESHEGQQGRPGEDGLQRQVLRQSLREEQRRREVELRTAHRSLASSQGHALCARRECLIRRKTASQRVWDAVFFLVFVERLTRYAVMSQSRDRNVRVCPVGISSRTS